MNKDFLLEIGTEELPPKQIDDLVAALANNLELGLKEHSLTFSEIKTFSSPRRLAVLISDLIDKQPDQETERKGPSIELAFDKSGKPTIAATKFAASCKSDVSELTQKKEKNRSFLVYKTITPGKNTIDLLPGLVTKSIKKLPLKKPMYWGKHAGPFARPVHWILALFANKTISLEIFSIKSSNKTFGHRFHHPDAITISEPKQYEKLLHEKGYVIVDAKKRKQKIREQIIASVKKGYAAISEELLSEVTNITEWPIILVGSFDKKFLKIPKDALITTLKTHQRCFPVVDKEKKLLPYFVVVSNIKSSTPEKVVAGNKKVIRARFSDAQYFYESDLKQDFTKNLDKLKSIAFQEKLGSLYDKTMRLKKLSAFIASQINADIVVAERAAELSKCDLVTSMVWEFPELQGIMGQHYAGATEKKDVAIAIKEQYLPRFFKDETPETLPGCALALSDRIDNLVGFFGIDKPPTGDKDPFSLRRAAMGVLQIILDKNLQINLKEAFEKSFSLYENAFKSKDEPIDKLIAFIYDRLRHSYTEQNKNINIFRAVQASLPTNIQDFVSRFEAVDRFTKLPESSDLIEIYKRIKNILNKTEIPQNIKFNLNLSKQEEEKGLAKTIEKKAKTIFGLYQNKKYFAVLEELIKFKKPLGEFFDNVMVMDKDEKIRENRLALLRDLQNLFLLIADLAYLVSGERS